MTKRSKASSQSGDRQQRQSVAPRATQPAQYHRTGMHRSVLVGLAEERIAEARALASAGHWTGAAYLVGYGAELLLKAVIAKRKSAEFWPYEDVLDIWKTHSLDELIVHAGLAERVRVAAGTNRILLNNWRIVRR